MALRIEALATIAIQRRVAATGIFTRPDSNISDFRQGCTPQLLARFPALEAQALGTPWVMRYEEVWAHLLPGMRKGNPPAIEVGMKVAERAAKLAGLDMPAESS